MSPSRAPSAAPQLPGFTFERHLGGGGFADVFLYEQHRPRRKVAVKVLLDSILSPAAQVAFDDEADLMAQLSSHPSIVTIYEVGRAPDGRPYLAMQYCPGVNLGRRYRSEPLSVAEALRTGVEIASAVETAHRAGILHRDIKPHNILMTEYNEPLLTDFGIASTIEGGAAASEGMSVPWSPPESFAEPPQVGVATDVWALGATVYSLLAGRSPFEVPGATNGAADLITRIETARPAPTGRPDVPASLERVLATSMGRLPAQRYSSALAFARALQQVQEEMGFGATPVSIQDDVVDRPAAEPDDDDPGTRIRRVQVIDPTGPPPGTTQGAGRSAAREPVPAAGSGAVVGTATPGVLGGATPPGVPAAPDALDRTVMRARGGGWSPVPEAPPVEATVQRRLDESAPGGDLDEPEAPPRRSRVAVVAAAVTVVAVGAAVAAALSAGGGGDPRQAASSVPSEEQPADNLTTVPSATEVVGTASGTDVVFTWTNPDPQPGDTYLWRLLSLTEETTAAPVTDPTVTVPQQAGQTCIEVYVVRGHKSSIAPTRGCL